MRWRNGKLRGELGEVPVNRPLLSGAFFAAAAGLFLTMITFGISLPVLPRLVTGPLGGGSRDVGLVFGAFAVASVVSRPIVGASGDRYGRRSLVVAGGIATTAGLLAHVWADGILALAMARALAGAGYGALIVGLMTAGLDMAPASRRGEAANYLMIGMQLGLGVGPLMGEITLYNLGYNAVWYVAAGAAVVAVATAMGAIRPELRHLLAFERGSATLYPASVLPGAVALLGVVAFTGFLTFVPLHAEDVGMEQVATVLLVSSALVIVVRLSVARVVDAVGPTLTVAVGLGLEALGLLIMSYWVTPLGLYISVIVMSSGWALVPPSLMFAATRRSSERDRARAVSTFTMLMDSGMAVGPVLLGFVASFGGYRGAFSFGAMVAAIGLVLTLCFMADHGRR